MLKVVNCDRGVVEMVDKIIGFAADGSEKHIIKHGEFRRFVESSIADDELVLDCKEAENVFKNCNEYMIKLVEDNAFLVMGMINSVIENQQLKPESLDTLCKINSSLCNTAFRVRNLCNLFCSDDCIENRNIKPYNIRQMVQEFTDSIHDTLPVSMC